MLRTTFDELADSQQAHKDDHLVLHVRHNEMIVVSSAADSGDYATIAAALAAVPEGGGIIHIKAGTYAGGFSITTANVVLQGDPDVIIRSPLSATACITIAAADVTLDNIEIDGRRAGGASGVGVSVSSVDRFTLQRCHIHDTSSHGVYLANSADSKILHSRIVNVATNGGTYTAQSVLTGIHAQGSSTKRLLIAHNYLSGWSQAIGLWYGPNHCRIIFNEAIANYGYYNGVAGSTRSAFEDYGELATEHGNNLWAYNTIDGTTSECIECAQGVNGSQFIGNILRDWNHFGDNTGGCFKIADGGASQRTKGVTFRDNRIYANGTVPGEALVAGLYSTVEGNYFYDFTHSLTSGVVVLFGQCDSSHISNNWFSNCRGAIFVNASLSGLTIIGNHIVSPAAGQTNTCIRVDYGSYHNISDNMMDLGGVNCPGIDINSGASGGSRIERNTIVNAINRGIYTATADNIIKDNHIVTTNVFGCITMSGSGALRNIVENNYCDSANAARTIYLADSAANNTIRSNKIIGAAASVYLNGDAGTGNIITPNHLNNVTRYLEAKSLGAKTVGASPSTIAHGLGYTPTVVEITMTSDGNIWKSASSDATNIYLTADNSGRTAEVFVR